jgi:hypothetical protein
MITMLYSSFDQKRERKRGKVETKRWGALFSYPWLSIA